MTKNTKKLLAIGCLLGIAVVFVGASFSLAALPVTENTSPQNEDTNPTANNSYKLNVDIPGLEGEVNLPSYIKAVYKFGIGALAVLAMGMIMNGGYEYMFSAGDNITKVSNAKSRIWNALIGLFIALTSFLLLNTINPDLLEPAPGLSSVEKIEQKNIPKTQLEGQYCNTEVGPDCQAGLTCKTFPGAPIGTCEDKNAPEGERVYPEKCDPPCEEGFYCIQIFWDKYMCSKP